MCLCCTAFSRECHRYYSRGPSARPSVVLVRCDTQSAMPPGTPHRRSAIHSRCPVSSPDSVNSRDGTHVCRFLVPLPGCTHAHNPVSCEWLEDRPWPVLAHGFLLQSDFLRLCRRISDQ